MPAASHCLQHSSAPTVLPRVFLCCHGLPHPHPQLHHHALSPRHTLQVPLVCDSSSIMPPALTSWRRTLMHSASHCPQQSFQRMRHPQHCLKSTHVLSRPTLTTQHPPIKHPRTRLTVPPTPAAAAAYIAGPVGL
jgi:hypothetical protein